MTVLTVLVAADNWGSVARDKETHQELSMTIGNATWDIQQSKEEVGKNCWSISPFSDPTKTTIQDGDLMARLIIVDPYPFSNQKVAPVVSPGPKLPFVCFFFRQLDEHSAALANLRVRTESQEFWDALDEGQGDAYNGWGPAR